jgi:hypothetical protein
MAVFEVQIKGIDQLVKSLNNAPSISEPILQRAIDASQAVLAKNTLKDDPVPWRTGNLLHSFRFESGRLQARWFPTANYASFVEYGRGFVYPQKGKVLAWTDQSGQTVFARYARPSKPRPFMGQILAKSQEGIEQVFRQALDLIVTQIANIGN